MVLYADVRRRTNGHSIPKHVERAASRAIDARRRFNNHHQQIGETPDSDAAHSHFLHILERCLGLLPRRDTTFHRGMTIKTDQGTARPALDRSHVGITNRFDALTIEDLEDNVNDEPVTARETFENGNNVSVQFQEAEDASVRETMEEELIIFHFFQDLDCVQKFLAETWTQYKDKHTDLLTATILTNAAIGIVQRAEVELLDQCDIKTEKCYIELVCRVWPFLGTVPKDQEACIWLEPEKASCQAGRSLRLGAYQALRNFAASTIGMSSKSTQPLDFHIPSLQHLRSHMQSLYPELKVPVNTEEMVQEYGYLVQIMMELAEMKQRTENAHLKGLNSVPEIAAPWDEITKSLWTVTRSKISVHAVFAAQVLLDIRNVLGDYMIREPCQIMAKLCNEQGNVLKGPAGLNQPFSDPYWTILPVEAKELVLRLMTLTKTFPLNSVDSHDAVTLASTKNRKKMNAGTIPRYPEVNISWQWNPVSCGTIIMNVRLLAEKIGVAAANRYGDVTQCAWIYAALRQDRDISEPWSDMDQVLRVQSVNLFGKSTITNKEELGEQYLSKLGRARLPYGNRSNNSWLDTTELSKLLLRQVEKTDSIVRTTYALWELCSKKQIVEQSFPPIELLSELRKALPDLLQPLLVRYIRTAKDSKRVVNTIAEAAQFPMLSSGDESKFLVAATVLNVDSQPWSRQQRRTNEKALGAGKSGLKVAADVIRALLSESAAGSRPVTSADVV